MILCRIIMGNVESVQNGSDQFQPSSENFDSAVDDLGSPKHYIIWHMHTGTRIYPEFVVAIKAPPRARGKHDGQKFWLFVLQQKVFDVKCCFLFDIFAENLIGKESISNESVVVNPPSNCFLPVSFFF